MQRAPALAGADPLRLAPTRDSRRAHLDRALAHATLHRKPAPGCVRWMREARADHAHFRRPGLDREARARRGGSRRSARCPSAARARSRFGAFASSRSCDLGASCTREPSSSRTRDLTPARSRPARPLASPRGAGANSPRAPSASAQGPRADAPTTGRAATAPRAGPGKPAPFDRAPIAARCAPRVRAPSRTPPAGELMALDPRAVCKARWRSATFSRRLTVDTDSCICAATSGIDSPSTRCSTSAMRASVSSLSRQP